MYSYRYFNFLLVKKYWADKGTYKRTKYKIISSLNEKSS